MPIFTDCNRRSSEQLHRRDLQTNKQFKRYKIRNPDISENSVKRIEQLTEPENLVDAVLIEYDLYCSNIMSQGAHPKHPFYKALKQRALSNILIVASPHGKASLDIYTKYLLFLLGLYPSKVLIYTYTNWALSRSPYVN